MSDIKPDLLTKLAEKCAAEHYGYGFDRKDLESALLAFGRELLSECLKVVEEEQGKYPFYKACERIATRFKELLREIGKEK
jgi:hypothetical protein